MNKGIWQIDYSNQIITITDSRDSLQLSGKEKSVPFEAYGKGVPILDIYDAKKHLGTALLDTGFNGDLTIGQEEMPPNYKHVVCKGISYGLHSNKEKVVKITRLPQIKLGNQFVVYNQIGSFVEQTNLNLIGNGFLRNYLITIDWFSQELLLEPIENKSEKAKEKFGFSVALQGEKVVVGVIYENAPVYKEGLRLYDEVLKINEIEVGKNPKATYCQVRSIIKNPLVKTVNITVKEGFGTKTYTIDRYPWLDDISN